MATATTIADVALSRRLGSISTLALIVSGSILTAIASQVQVPLPFTPVPVNGLTFAVLLLGVTLGWHRAAAAVLLFIGEGLMGIPVFAQHHVGWATLMGPTGGYLMGAPLAAALVGYLAQRRWDRNVFTLLLALVIGDAIMFGFGVAWLSRFTLPTDALHAGLIPFIPGEAVKIALVMVLLPTAWHFVGPELANAEPRGFDVA